DNVIPAFHGGLRACLREDGRVMHFCLLWPSDLGVVVCVPDFTVSTQKARRALPAKIAFQDAVHTSSRLALLISALEQGEYAWLKTAMRDVLHQPHRKKLIRGMDVVIQAAVKAGAFGASLSGSGPAIIAIALKGAKQAKIGRAMQKAFFRHGAESRYFVLDTEPKGARIETL
ncbi:MAG: homoserine kinase, partial [Elusimicrobiota bacterium]